MVAVKNAQKILSSHLKHTNAVFKILVEERYKENILTLTDLLEWKLWPCLIKYYGEFYSLMSFIINYSYHSSCRILYQYSLYICDLCMLK